MLSLAYHDKRKWYIGKIKKKWKHDRLQYSGNTILFLNFSYL